MVSPLLLLRLFLGRFTLVAFLQDAFIAAEIALLPKWLYLPLFLFQWGAILMANRLQVRMTPSLLFLLRHPGSLIDSVRDVKLLRWLILGGIVCWLWPFKSAPLPLLVLALLTGPLAAHLTRKLDSATELKAFNPLFYLQWKGWIHPRKKGEQALPRFDFPGEMSLPVDPEFPLLRKRTQFTSPRKFDISIAPGENPHILFLFLESFRAQNVGALGAEIAASPHFDALAKEGALFTQCSATGPQTFYAAVSSLFGVQPSLNTFLLRSYMDTPLIGLPRLLKERGYRTAWLESCYVDFNGARPFFHKNGIEEIEGAEKYKTDSAGMSWGVHDADFYRHANEWLKKQKQPSFGVFFTATNHHPWEPPPNWRFDAPKHLPPPYQRYLNTFAYSDACLGHFVKQLEKEGLLDKTLLFIMGDHGQQMCERSDNYATRISLHQPNVHVPLLIYAKGRMQPQRVDSPCSHVDLFSTVLDLMQLGGAHHSMGRSLLREGAGASFFSLPAAVARWGCRSGAYKWMGLETGEEEELYNLEQDPEEKINLARVEKVKNEELKALAMQRFAAAEILFETKRWAPAQADAGKILEASPEMNAAEFEKALEKTVDFYGVDLSRSSKLKDRSLIQLAERAGDSLRYLHLPNSPFITDESLFAIAKKCPHLTDFYSLHCPLVTEKGIEAILDGCPKLRVLSLDDLDLGTALNPKNELKALNELFLGENLSMEGEALSRFLKKCPNLIHGYFNLRKTSREDLQTIAELPFKLSYVQLSNAPELTEEILKTIAEKNPHLYRLKITNCPKLFSCDLRARPWLTHLELQDCPHLKSLHLEGVSIKNLTLLNCPHLETDQLKPLCRLIVSDCPKITQEQLLSLRAAGVNIL